MTADATAPAEAWVYLLRCNDGSLYCGWTIDLDRRLQQHRAGRASRYTRTRLPVTLAFVAEMKSRQAARREEARIKRLSRQDKLALISRDPLSAPVST
jgi:putative endonuclease